MVVESKKERRKKERGARMDGMDGRWGEREKESRKGNFYLFHPGRYNTLTGGQRESYKYVASAWETNYSNICG